MSKIWRLTWRGKNGEPGSAIIHDRRYYHSEGSFKSALKRFYKRDSKFFNLEVSVTDANWEQCDPEQLISFLTN